MTDLHSTYKQYITKAYNDLTISFLPKYIGPFVMDLDTLEIDVEKSETNIKYFSDDFNYYIHVYLWPKYTKDIRLDFFYKETNKHMFGYNAGHSSENIINTFQKMCLEMNKRLIR